MFQSVVIVCLLGLTGALPDDFEKYPHDLVVVAGTPVTYECKLKESNEYLARMFVQFVNGSDMILNSKVNGGGYFEVSRLNKVVTLKILNVTQETVGKYRCFGLALVGDIDVNGPYKELQVAEPPEIELRQQVTVAEMGSVVLSATFTGLPLPNVTLYHQNGTKLTSMVEADSLSYELFGVTKSDAGNYTFIASNIMGRVESAVQVTVRYKPQIMTVAVTRKHKISSNVSFACKVDSHPASKIEWLHNNTKLRNLPGEVSLLSDGGLVIYNVGHNHSGTFTCKASNALGEDRKDFTLFVQVAPGVPGKPNVVSYNQTTARLRWTAGFDGNSEITGYKLEYQYEANNWERLAGKIPSVEYVITSLKPNTNYRFRLRALNSVGHSLWSEASEAIVTDPLAPLKPESPAIENLKATEFVFFWEAPFGYSVNGIYGTIRGYKVEWWVASEGRSKASSRNVTSKHETTLRGLKKGTEYVVIVSAYNRGYIGHSSDQSVTITLKTIPGAPTDVTASPITSKSIRLEWKTPSDIGGGTVTEVIVEYRVSGSGNWLRAPIQPAVGDVSVLVGELREKTRYELQVSLVNEKGQGPFGVASPVTTPDSEAPASPSLTINSVGINEVTLAWSKTGENEVYSWSVEIKREESADWEVLQDLISASTTSRIVNQLNHNTSYWFRVAASNSFGYSPFSEVVRVTTKPLELPPPVSNVSVVQDSISSKEATITWDRSSEGVTSYIVQYRRADSKDWIEIVLDSDITSLLVSPLQGNSTYFFRVIVVKGELRSVPSDVSRFTTLSDIAPLTVGNVSDESFPLAALIAIGVVGGLVVVLLIVVLIGVYCRKQGQKSKDSSEWYDPPEDSTSWCRDESYRYTGSLPPSSNGKHISNDVQYAELHFEPVEPRPRQMHREDTPYADIDIRETVARAERSRSQSREPEGSSSQQDPKTAQSANPHPESNV